MPNRIKGITIQLDGDATPLQKALQGVNKDLKTTQSNLKDVNNLLKLDGGNVDLLKQKQQNLSNAIKDTEDKLKTEKEALAQLKDADQTPEVKAQMEALQRQISEDEQSLKKLKEEYKSFGSVAKQEIKAVGDQIKEMGDKIKAAGDKVKDVGDKIKGFGKTVTTSVTLPLAAIGTKGVASFAEVDKTMTLARKTMGATADEAEQLDAAMKSAAANSTYGMSDAADAMLNFARAGLTADEAADTLAPAMNLAAGEGGDLDTVSGGLVATINGFADGFDKTTHYADVFANACNNSALDVNSLSESMSIAAPIFAAAGYKVEDAALYMGILADNGIDANKGATSLKTGMARLVAPAKQGAEMMEKLGISVTNADGSMKDTITIQRELHDTFAELSESEQLAAASAIFGKNQMAPWLALINAAPADVEELSQALGVEGTTAEMAETMMSGFGGSIEKLKSSIDVAVTSLGEALAPVISIVADKIQAVVDWFNSLDKEQQQHIATIGLVVAAIGPVITIIGGVISAIGTVIGAIGGIISIGGALISALGLLLSPVGLVVAAIAAAIAVGVLLYQNWDKICEWAGKLKENVSKAWEELKANVSQTIGILKEAISQTWEAIKEKVLEVVEAIKTKVTEIWENIKETVTTTVEAIKTAVTEKWEAVKSKVTEIVDAVESKISDGFEAAKKVVTDVFDSIHDTISEKMEAAKNIVSNVVEAIKGFFQFEWSLPELKLPHIVVSDDPEDYITVPVLGTIPKPSAFSIEWYKKAYDQPYLFTSPTVVGGRGFGDGGGSGEIVYGRDQLMRDIALAAGETTNIINVYAADGMDINALADAIQDRLVQLQLQKEAVFA